MLPEVLPLAVDELIQRMERLKVFCAHRIERLERDAEYEVIDGILNLMVEARSEIVDLKGRPGAADYVRKVFGDARIDVVQHMNAVQTAIEAVGTAIRNGAPTGTGQGAGYILAYQYNADPAATPVRVWRTLTPTQTAPLRALLEDVITAVDAFFASLTAALA